MLIIILNKSQETTVFQGRQKFSRAPEINFSFETKARKVMIDFKFDSLYWYVSTESLLKLAGVKKVNRKFVLVGGTVCANIHRECNHTL